ncbi:hypothetical protein ACFY04_12295 [Streptomyces sp. NPDC001549]|uniref:hypothetical protein n=1 Tax=Streptomyces sp. NPDC001549 TaxID=3364586 RepID=UPI0036B31B14
MDDVDRSGLFHAVGPASDTPRHPAALLGDDAKAFVDGYSHLWSATLRREGKAWPSTAPTALLVAELLDDPPLPDAMLAHLHAVGIAADLGTRAEEIRAQVANRAPELQARTASYLSADVDARARMWQDGTELGELVLDQATLACFDLVPALLRRALPHLASERGRRRACAAAAIGALARPPLGLAATSGAVEAVDVDDPGPRFLARPGNDADRPRPPRGDTRPWPTSPHADVRGCAALAPGRVGDDAADRVLQELAGSPRAFGESFGDMAPPLQLQSDRMWTATGSSWARAGRTRR